MPTCYLVGSPHMYNKLGLQREAPPPPSVCESYHLGCHGAAFLAQPQHFLSEYRPAQPQHLCPSTPRHAGIHIGALWSKQLGPCFLLGPRFAPQLSTKYVAFEVPMDAGRRIRAR